LNSVTVIDVNHDGVDEFIVVANDSDVVLVGSDGRAQWQTPFQAGDKVRQLTTVNVDGNEHEAREIAFTTGDQLVLLSDQGSEIWRTHLANAPAALGSVQQAGEGLEEIIVALESGILQSFDSNGTLIWQYEFTDPPAEEALPKIAVADLDRDGVDEIVFSYFASDGFSKLALIKANGERLWERSNSGLVSALAVAEFDSAGPMEIAVGTSLERVYLYTAEGERRWPFRSPNKPITSLTMVQLEQGPSLVVGTSVGTVIAYDKLGRRFWSSHYYDSPDRPVIAATAAKGAQQSSNPVALAAIFGNVSESGQPGDVLLLDRAGRRLEPSYPASDAAGLTRLVDINRDGKSELLLAGFATLELLAPGIGSSQYSEAWDYRLNAAPQSALVADIDLDGEQELLVGTNDGKLHSLRNNGTLFWLADLGGPVSHLAIADSADAALPSIVAVYNKPTPPENSIEGFEGWLEVLRPNGRTIWNVRLPSTVSSLLVADVDSDGLQEIVVGTTDGQVIVLSSSGEEIWRSELNESVDRLVVTNTLRGTEIVAGTAANRIYRLNDEGTASVRTAEYPQKIAGLEQIPADENLAPVLFVAVEDGTIRGLSSRGIQSWQVSLLGLPTHTLTTGDSLFVGTSKERLLNLDLAGTILWRASQLGRITSLYWGDLDGDTRPDIAVGTGNGEVQLLSEDGKETWGRLNLASELFLVSAIGRPPGLQMELVAVTDNGVVQLFRPRANRPPLLINPQTDVSQGGYSIAVSVLDLENDPVRVSLEIFDPESGSWVDLGEKSAIRGNDTLFWPVDPPQDATEISYRLEYDDGTHVGQLEPLPGPAPLLPDPLLSNVLIAIVTLLFAGVGASVYVIQRRSPEAQMRRFHQRVLQNPDATLELLESEYVRTGGSPDFLLNLASRARRERNHILASVADGLFLLSARPESALPIINNALNEVTKMEPRWRGLDDWQLTYSTGQALLTAPSITELSLLWPQLQQYLLIRKEGGRESRAMEGLLPVLTTLRDGERVHLADDRMVYLNEAIGLLRQLQHHAGQWQVQIENALAQAMIDRWFGQISAEVEELQGRAQLVITLLTKNLVPEKTTVVAVDINNVGRAPAEDVVISLEAAPTYKIVSAAQVVPILSPGRRRQVDFIIEPQVNNQFRTVFTITYNDRHGKDKRTAFADMVHLLPPVREFEPIMNPYSPGMPLRRNSGVFFGREDLFEFVGQNSKGLSQQNVLILVGQRRTGKTSALLRLDRHLPDRILPIYIDCQSLGVIPGMPALLHDLAWTIADSLAGRGIELVVPEAATWVEDPGGRFQRQFMSDVFAALPAETTILLIFDEFEAFENLVSDAILPPTLYTYLRHLMQHGERLSFIFAGTHRLEEMGTDYWSVLFNTALYWQVGFLKSEAAERLVRDPVAPHITYDDLAVEKILRVTAGHPYFLQLVCYSLINRANQRRSGYITISDVNAALEEMLRLGEVHFAYLWQRSSHTEKALLAAAARISDLETPFRPADLVQYLAEYSIYLDPADIMAGLSRLVEREIIREVTRKGTPFYELQIGLVGLWVAQNKSLIRLYESRDEVNLTTF
jgi:outer membrane protein assembly factor BamB